MKKLTLKDFEKFTNSKNSAKIIKGGVSCTWSSTTLDGEVGGDSISTCDDGSMTLEYRNADGNCVQSVSTNGGKTFGSNY